MLLRTGFVAILAAACLWAQDPQEKTPQDKQPDDITVLLAAGNTSYLKGAYPDAREQFDKAWDLAKVLPNSDITRYEVLKRLSTVHAAVGEYQQANDWLSMAISWREQINGSADPKLPDDLIVAVGYLRAMKDYPGALALVQRVIGLHMRLAGGTPNSNVADDFSRMSLIYLAQKDTDKAIGALKMALDIRTKLMGPLDPSLVFDLDRLGSVYTSTQDYEHAEETYRHALVIRESMYGRNDADLIPDIDGLAFALFGQKKYDEAEPVYLRLIDLWTSSTAEDHPMLAVAWQKLGVFYFEQKKYDQAKEAYDKGIGIRTLFLGNGLSEQASDMLLKEGDKAAAVAQYQRALKVLDPPDKVYAKLRKDIELLIPELTKKTNAEWKTPAQMTKKGSDTAKPDPTKKK